MKCLIDSDILVYEIANCGQYTDPESGELIVREFDYVAGLLDQKIQEIEALCWATEPSVLYLTGDRKLTKSVNKKRKYEGKEEVEFVPNFRFKVAKKKKYKAGRKPDKPFHYNNIREYMLANYECVIAEGMEADDMICVELVRNGDQLSVICCSRDKDLRMVAGMHFGWECGRQPQFGPQRVDFIGEIRLSKDRKVIKGEGIKFFYSQLITGDGVDNIPGLRNGGPVLAFKSLSDLGTEELLFECVAGLYEAEYGQDWRTEFQEQADLLWMIRELDEEGKPVKYVMLDERNK
ncbi:MAG: hypothetical protein [Bacteriophage sp.]|nr:MAG: hypothetical protein [Bacteriophage sp.]